LIGEEEDGLQGELAITKVEEIFQAGSKEVEHHRVVVTLGAKPPNKGDTDTTGKGLVHLAFVFELGMLSLDRL